MPISCHPLPKAPESAVDFGVEVRGLDLENLSDSDFESLRTLLYTHQVVVIKNQQALSPSAQYTLTRRFDPSAGVYSHGAKISNRSVLHRDLTTIPSQPQVQVIGHGHIPSYEGLTDLHLQHPHHRTFHRDPIPADQDHDFTHFYRWHIDSAMYDLDPPLVTSLLAVKTPPRRFQTVLYSDSTNCTLRVPLGTTAFFSGSRLFSLLSPAEQSFVLTSKVEYAPHPYIWMSEAKSRSNGLGILSENLELPLPSLPPISPEKVRVYPMAWKNPVTGALAMMVYPTCVRKIHLADGTVMEDLAEVRETLYKLQRRAIDPELIYPHDWVEGDLVLFNNHGVMHSIVGSFAEEEVRLFRQCNMAGSRGPLGPDDQI
ncbi:Clavaminate synthase-like protein [Aspergillus sclerotiicarbonarius CBS 121057]|uniref:Clavaminate synthase-like protein n=1 Tax=Aspergillus sclerotiicarbonarius (strain CBS 121057 / IBT 28362) TaxID=1448318 RepID=A0A319E3Q8_ASPSB|nr:Clavaminate synthase-like protein [Aspergillus sclerotiicarbonarius CBS 121057]